MKTFWDERYDSEDYVYGKEPNEFFAETLRKLDPGHILLPAEGEGRNAVFAAGLGWKVHAFDSSRVAEYKALSLAAERNVNILYSIADVDDFDPGDYKYDVIGLIYTHFHPQVRSNFFKLMTKCLAPGGKIILEGFEKKQINLSTGGPKDLSMLFSVEELEKNFDGLHFEYLKAESITLAESDVHNGRAEVVRMVAIKS